MVRDQDWGSSSGLPVVEGKPAKNDNNFGRFLAGLLLKGGLHLYVPPVRRQAVRGLYPCWRGATYGAALSATQGTKTRCPGLSVVCPPWPRLGEGRRGDGWEGFCGVSANGTLRAQYIVTSRHWSPPTGSTFDQGTWPSSAQARRRAERATLIDFFPSRLLPSKPLAGMPQNAKLYPRDMTDGYPTPLVFNSHQPTYQLPNTINMLHEAEKLSTSKELPILRHSRFRPSFRLPYHERRVKMAVHAVLRTSPFVSTIVPANQLTDEGRCIKGRPFLWLKVKTVRRDIRPHTIYEARLNTNIMAQAQIKNPNFPISGIGMYQSDIIRMHLDISGMYLSEVCGRGGYLAYGVWGEDIANENPSRQPQSILTFSTQKLPAGAVYIPGVTSPGACHDASLALGEGTPSSQHRDVRRLQRLLHESNHISTNRIPYPGEPWNTPLKAHVKFASPATLGSAGQPSLSGAISRPLTSSSLGASSTIPSATTKEAALQSEKASLIEEDSGLANITSF
ncbi:uncharacterized protein CLUP02_12612 [Colletotrichum lupini]|uniref:Uncharacterized protein n=1 Tax=Colletotrichum lupini TaxID=145971 RepID=A0A9Q8WLJ8_9PEZI|nr:uncharacterized protein CLUP02_12612 [Colletotrichum lupini]UQC87110.1 hypothetical protein CLUP02_12612 [Colletotrichum lupini]